MRSRQSNYLVLGLVLLAYGISITLIQYKIPSILGDVMSVYSMNATTGTWLMSIYTAMGIFLTVPAGMLSKRIGAKVVLAIGGIIAMAGSILGAFASNEAILILSRGIEGISFVFATVAVPLVIDQSVEEKHRSTVNGIWSLWICFGAFLGLTITPIVHKILGLFGIWIVYGILSVITTCVAKLYLRNTGVFPAKDADSQNSPSPDSMGLRSFLKPAAFLYFFAYLVFNIEILAVLSYTPALLQMRGCNPSMSGIASSIPGLIAIVASPLAGKIIDRTGKSKPLYTAALVASAIATFLMLTQTGPLLWIGAIAMGAIGYAAPVAALSSLPQIAGSKKLMSAATSALMLVQCLGDFLGSLLTPLLLGAQMDNWLLCGSAILVIGLLGAAALLPVKFR